MRRSTLTSSRLGLGNFFISAIISPKILDFKGEDDRYVFQGVHMLMDGAPMGAWPKGPRQSRLVFIGRDLDTMDLEDGFAALA